MIANSRKLSDVELKAWTEYYDVLNKYDETYHVKMYDRPSIHKAFPEINKAFEHACAMRTYTILRDGIENE